MMELDERRIAAYFLQHVGEYSTSYRTVKETGAYFGDLEKLDMNELFTLEEKVFEVAEKYGFILDKSHHEGMEEGLPWNLDYLILHR